MNVWEGLTNNTVDNHDVFNYKKGAVYHALNRNNLRLYIDSYTLEDINKISLVEFFSRENLEKSDRETGYYLPHMLFQNAFPEDKVSKILECAFEFVSPYQSSEQEGYSYLQTMFRQWNPYSEEFIFKVMKEAVELGTNLNHTSFDGTTLLHWAIMRNGYQGTMTKLMEVLPSDFNYRAKNHQNIGAYQLYRIVLFWAHNDIYINFNYSNNTYIKKEYPDARVLEIEITKDRISCQNSNSKICLYNYKKEELLEPFFFYDTLTHKNLLDKLEISTISSEDYHHDRYRDKKLLLVCSNSKMFTREVFKDEVRFI